MGPQFMTLMTSQSRGKGQPFQQMELGQLNIHRGEKKKMDTLLHSVYKTQFLVNYRCRCEKQYF